MKKTLFLILFVLFAWNLLWAQNEDDLLKLNAKEYNIGDGGIISFSPAGPRSLNVNISYNRPSEAPQKAKEHLGMDRDGKLKGVTDKFTVKILDEGGREMCRQSLSYNDFTASRTSSGGSIGYGYTAQGCGRNGYEKVGGAIVEYR